MNYQEQVDQFQKSCQGLIREMSDWFHGIGSSKLEEFTPEQAFEEQLRQEQRNLEEQLQFTKRVIQDGRQARQFLNDPFVQTLREALRLQVREKANETLDTAKGMEDIKYAKGWKDGVQAFFSKLETLIKLGDGAEKTLVSLTREKTPGRTL